MTFTQMSALDGVGAAKGPSVLCPGLVHSLVHSESNPALVISPVGLLEPCFSFPAVFVGVYLFTAGMTWEPFMMAFKKVNDMMQSNLPKIWHIYLFDLKRVPHTDV